MMAKTSRLFKDQANGVLAKIEYPGESKNTPPSANAFRMRYIVSSSL